MEPLKSLRKRCWLNAAYRKAGGPHEEPCPGCIDSGWDCDACRMRTECHEWLEVRYELEVVEELEDYFAACTQYAYERYRGWR